MKTKINRCKWIGYGEKCNCNALIGKSYCLKHQDRIYERHSEEMATYIVDKEIKEAFDKTET
jgi:hypothetical protein